MESQLDARPPATITAPARAPKKTRETAGAAMTARLHAAMAKLPLVAILRGVTPREAPDIAEALLEEDFELIEIPLNSPSR